jgi:hypothetical protein
VGSFSLVSCGNLTLTEGALFVHHFWDLLNLVVARMSGCIGELGPVGFGQQFVAIGADYVPFDGAGEICSDVFLLSFQ